VYARQTIDKHSKNSLENYKVGNQNSMQPLGGKVKEQEPK